MFAGRNAFRAGTVSLGVGAVGSVCWCRGSRRRVASVRSCCTFQQVFVRFVSTLMGTYVPLVLFRSGRTHVGLVSTSFLELFPPPFFSTVSIRSCPWSCGRVPARVHSTSAPRTMLSRCVSLLFGSLLRLACARALVSRANARTQRFVFRLLFVFLFFGVRTEFVGRLCRALLRGNSACFSVSFFFLEREDTEEIERKKKRERAEGTQPYEVKEPGKRPVVSSSHVVVRVVRFLRTFVVERFQVFLPTVTCTKRNRPS